MDRVVEDAAGAIDDLELHRLHYTYTMTDFGTFKEDYRYVLRNSGSKSHTVVPLLWRWREIQANMVVLDAEDKNLVYLPRDITNSAIELYISQLLDRGALSSSVAEPVLPSRMSAVKDLIRTSLAFESPHQSRVNAFVGVTSLSSEHKDVGEFARAARFLALLSEFYVPFALLPNPLEPQGFTFLRHGVDLYLPVVQRKRLMWPQFQVNPIRFGSLLRFFLTGRLLFRVPIALEALRVAKAKAFHCRIVVPSGLRIASGVRLEPVALFAGFGTLGRTSYDESNVYTYASQAELDQLHAKALQLESVRRKAANEILMIFYRLRRRFAQVELSKAGVGLWRAFKQGVLGEPGTRLQVVAPLIVASGVRSLVMLLWMVAGASLGAGVLGLLDLDRFLTLLGLLLVVVLTIGIFAVDKRILREFVSAHALSAVAVSLEAFILSLMH